VCGMCTRSCFCVGVCYCVSVIVIEFSISQESAAGARQADGRDEKRITGRRECRWRRRECGPTVLPRRRRRRHSAFTVSHKYTLPVFFLFLRNPQRRTWIRSAQQCGRRPPIPERYRWPLSINRKY